jgi:hypothetical protein
MQFCRNDIQVIKQRTYSITDSNPMICSSSVIITATQHVCTTRTKCKCTKNNSSADSNQILAQISTQHSLLKQSTDTWHGTDPALAVYTKHRHMARYRPSTHCLHKAQTHGTVQTRHSLFTRSTDTRHGTDPDHRKTKGTTP